MDSSRVGAVIRFAIRKKMKVRIRLSDGSIKTVQPNELVHNSRGDYFITDNHCLYWFDEIREATLVFIEVSSDGS